MKESLQNNLVVPGMRRTTAVGWMENALQMLPVNPHGPAPLKKTEAEVHGTTVGAKLRGTKEGDKSWWDKNLRGKTSWDKVLWGRNFVGQKKGAKLRGTKI